MPQSNSYSDQFKPALIFGVPPLSMLTDSVYLTKTQEDYNHNGSHMSEVTPNPHEKGENTQTGFYYELETMSKEASPTVRLIKVKDKVGFSPCFLIEPRLGARGVAVVMFKEVKINKVTQVYCNMRVLPYSTLSEIMTSNSKPDDLVIDLTKDEIVKLNITLEASNTGELLYKTHKTKVLLKNISPDEKLLLTQEVEFELAKMTAHIVRSMLDISPDKKTDEQSEYTSHYTIAFPSPENAQLKLNLLAVGIISSLMIDLTGSIAVGDINNDWQYSSYFLDQVLN